MNYNYERLNKSDRSWWLIIVLIFLTPITYSYNHGNNKIPFGEIAKRESAIPIHPGIPGKVSFWNKYAKRFIYAPAFDYPETKNANKYKYEILCLSDSSRFSFEENIPYAPLSPIWAKMPVGYFELRVIGLSKNDDSIGLAGKGKYYRAAYFNGPYNSPLLPYDSSGIVALLKILHTSYVSNWLQNQEPDSTFQLYRYPAKIYSAIIRAGATYAKFHPHTEDGKQAIKIAEIVANKLLKISFSSGSAWAYFPPTYYGSWIKKLNQPSWIKVNNMIPHFGVHAGFAYLDLYNVTGNKKYFQAAERIASTLIKNQLPNGSWYLYVNPYNGKPTEPTNNISIPTIILNYLYRLQNSYGIKGLDVTINKAFNWIMDNPVKTFNWQGQYEDVGTHPPYKDQNRTEACEFATYLFKHKKDKKYLTLAEDLLRFSEDQFVIWEKPRPINHLDTKDPIFNSDNWVTPCATEQYVYWMPTCIATMRMAKAYWYAYLATKKDIYLTKAESFANTMTVLQRIYHGNYSTYFSKGFKGEEWLNCTVYAANEMIRLGREIKENGSPVYRK